MYGAPNHSFEVADLVLRKTNGTGTYTMIWSGFPLCAGEPCFLFLILNAGFRVIAQNTSLQQLALLGSLFFALGDEASRVYPAFHCTNQLQ